MILEQHWLSGTPVDSDGEASGSEGSDGKAEELRVVSEECAVMD